MKKIALSLLAAAMMFSGTNISAQDKYGPNREECIKYLSYYSEYYKQKNYDEAFPSWQKAYEICPATASENLFVHGSTLLRRAISQNAKDPEKSKELIETLLQLHDTRVANYPKRAVSILNSKGLDLHNYIKGDDERVYKEYKAIIDANKGETDGNIFLFEIEAATQLVQDGKIGAEDYINEYQANLEFVPEDKRPDYEGLFISSKVASCENLLELFTPRFAANPNDAELVSNIVKMMSITEGCTDNDLYLKAVSAMYANEPSHTSAYYLFRLHSSRGNNSEAIKFMEEAIASPESDSATDANYEYELALFCYKNNMSGKAFAAAQRASDLNPELSAKCYMLIGTIWGSTVCQGNEIERRAPYWVAVDYLTKAKNADPSLADEANNLIRQYAAYFPQTADAFMYDLTDGQSYRVSCGGMSASTTVRTQK